MQACTWYIVWTSMHKGHTVSARILYDTIKTTYVFQFLIVSSVQKAVYT